MSKERLEEIAKNIKLQAELTDNGLIHQVILKQEDYVYLQRQADQNKRYREAYENAKYKYISLAPYGAEMQRDGMLQEINKALEESE